MGIMVKRALEREMLLRLKKRRRPPEVRGSIFKAGPIMHEGGTLEPFYC